MAKQIAIRMEIKIEEHLPMDKIVDKALKKTHTIEVTDAKVWYDDFMAIQGIDMVIKPNTVTAFIGPSGCGKSTFLRLFNRMNDYVDGFKMEGKIKVNGRNIYKDKIHVEELRKEIGMVFQKPNPFPKSIFENVAYGLKIQGIKDKKLISVTGNPDHPMTQGGLCVKLKDYEQLYDWAVKGEDKPCWASEELEEAVNKIVDLADVISLQPSEDLEYEGQAGDCRLDLHEANVMSRSDGTLVFTDPLSDAQMFDAPAIEEWIDDYLYYTNKK